MPAGTSISSQAEDPLGARRLVTTEAILVTPPTIVALQGRRSGGAPEDLLPRARRALSLGFPLSPSSGGGAEVRVAVAGRLGGGGGGAARGSLVVPGWGAGAAYADFGPWELWSDRDVEWRGSGARRGADDAALLREVGAALRGRSTPGPGELLLPHRRGGRRAGQPARWWLRLARPHDDAAGVRIVRAVSAQVIGVTASARVVPEGGGVEVAAEAAVAEPSWRAPSPLMTSQRLPFRLELAPR